MKHVPALGASSCGPMNKAGGHVWSMAVEEYVATK